MLLEPRQTVTCPPVQPCACATNETCVKINRSDTQCATVSCVPTTGNSSSSGSGGVSKGALAGAVVGALIFLVGAVCLFLWYRKSQRLRKHSTFEAKSETPASAETVLSRPNPTEKSLPVHEAPAIRRYSNTIIDLDPQSQQGNIRRTSQQSNPFADNHTIQTAGSEGTNVIPIALVSPDPAVEPVTLSRSSSTNSPSRPVRSPDLNLNLDHINVSADNVGKPGRAKSQISGISGVSSRNSYMSNASYSSDMLNEAAMIVTPTQGAFRQVLGVVKAEVINTNSITSQDLKGTSLSRKPTVSSPLAATSFGSDAIMDTDTEEHEGNPFSDKHTSTETQLASDSSSVTTFGQPSPLHDSNWHADSPVLPWAHKGGQSRPSSMGTEAGSVIIGIENARRVNLGLNSEQGTPRSPYRTTIGRLVTPSTAGGLDVLQEQQRKALEAQARAQGQDLDRRVSNSSVLTTSTRADSILESFPFVPPSPISSLPSRSPPVSPLGKQSFSVTPPSPGFKGNSERDSSVGPSRHTLGLSTASAFSNASTGLGSFPFQIDSGSEAEITPLPSYPGRQRASLDTLALTNDLSSYPLAVERDSTTLPYKN